VRAAYGLPKVTSFDQITSDPDLQAQLQSLYGTVDNIDLWVGGLAEDHVAGSSVGRTFRTILSDQFERLRDGDRFWYQNLFAAGTRQRDELDRLDLSDIVRRNSGTTNVQDNVFVLDVSVSGSLFNDGNGNGRRDFREGALRGWTVQLLDADGNVVGSTVTNDNGRYSFVGLELGTYTVNVVTPAGWRQTTRALRPASITRGMTVSGLDAGFMPVSTAVV
jgi:peroxidase